MNAHLSCRPAPALFSSEPNLGPRLSQIVRVLTLSISCHTVPALQGQGLLSEAAQWGKLLATVPDDIRENLDSRWKVGLSLLWLIAA